jgi:hypothetical protein
MPIDPRAPWRFEEVLYSVVDGTGEYRNRRLVAGIL